MAASFQTQRRVEFCDTDMAGIVHFANFFRYMEAAEHAWFRSLGLKIAGELPDGRSYGWPRVSATCDYKSPARYEDVIDIQVTLVQRKPRSLTTIYEFTLKGKLLARGEMKTVFCLIQPGQPLQSADIPAEIATPLDGACRLDGPCRADATRSEHDPAKSAEI